MAAETFHDHNAKLIAGPGIVTGAFLLSIALAIAKNDFASPIAALFLFLGSFTVVSALLLYFRRTNYLKLTEKGFSYRWGIHKGDFVWQDCESFETRHQGYYWGPREYVVFSTRDIRGSKKSVGRFFHELFSHQYGLMGYDYGLPPKELAAKMNAYRDPLAIQHSRDPLSPEARNYFHNPNQKKRTPFLNFSTGLSLALSLFLIFATVVYLFPTDADYCAHDNNHQRGIGYCTTLIDSEQPADEERSGFHHNRGIHHKKRGELDLAIADFTRALRLQPDKVMSYVARANTYAKLKRHDEALADFQLAIDIQPDHLASYVGRGNVYMNQKRYDEALADYGEAVRLDPGNPVAFFNRGLVYKRLGQYGDAIAQFDAVLEIEWDHSDAKHQRRKAIRCRKKACKKA